jgi:hypothetical protein
MYGHTETVRALLDSGADIHAGNDWACNRQRSMATQTLCSYC